GTPDRKYLWVLSRTKQADPSVVEALLQFAEAQDFDIDAVIRQ
ncbi:MAG TPA: lipocalin, partial [Alcaligenaceae bacterium]|nr:lipocalin [Alcaligenaceae bacterium]